MRSPLELPEGRFDHALLTTYSFNLRFFEEWVLRALWAAEVRNVVVLVDPHELGHALGDRAPSLAGRAYHLVAGAGARVAFHPKVLLLSGRDGARLCVSSANLTADGQLRNAESAIAFDWHLAGHKQPIRDAAEFFRRLSEGAPAHTARAIHHAISALPEADEPSQYRFVHNFDRPLIEVFPRAGSIRAVAPYVDADGTAARELQARGSLTIVVDGEQIVAAAEFFAAPWDVEAHRFDARLHGKAYEVTMPQGRWTLIGSPNLSEPALLQRAASGNLEVAIAVSEAPPLELPASESWDGEEVGAAAARRLAAAHREREISGATPRAFNAWEEERRIVVDGVPDGTRVERWSDERWHYLGTVSDSAVLLSDPELRPTRIRALTPDGKLAFAVVAQPAPLRARMRARSRGRQTESAEHLPLDIETVRVLEQTLSELYALSELAGEVRIQRPPVRTASAEAPPSLLEWKPRHPDEEPRIPPLYKRNWKGEPDALLTLVGRVLRLEPDLHPVSEADVAREQIDVEAVGKVTSEEELEGEQPPQKEPPKIRTQRDELEGYRKAFLRLFRRGQDFIESAPEPDLAGLAFTYLERLVEELGFHRVEVDGQDEPLMPHPTLQEVNLDLLEDYLGRGEHDPLCLATARAHLAVAIRELPRYSARDGERVEDLAYKWAAELIAVPTEIPAPSREHLDFDPSSAAAWLDNYAERSDWSGIEREAARRLGVSWLERAPFSTIVGEASFGKRIESPAWGLLAFAAPAGFTSRQPFAVAVRNDADSPTAVHVLVCSPVERVILEAWLRATDWHWLEQRYRAPTQSVVEDMDGPFMLERTRSVTEHASLGNVDPPLKALTPLLEDVARVFS